jgi:uncharacterized protein YegP (UPF0339 family)
MTPLLYFVIAAVVVALLVVALFRKPQVVVRDPVSTETTFRIRADKFRIANPAEEPMPRKPKFEVYQDNKREWRWRLKAANGRIVAVGEGHTRKRDAERAARMVAETAGKAEVVEA